jgi:hypothetical protein
MITVVGVEDAPGVERGVTVRVAAELPDEEPHPAVSRLASRTTPPASGVTRPRPAGGDHRMGRSR